MSNEQTKDQIRKVLLGIIAIGFMFFALDVMSYLSPQPQYAIKSGLPPKSLSSMTLLGLIGMFIGFGGFYFLHKSTQPDSENAFIRILQQTARGITGEAAPITIKSEDEIAKETESKRLSDQIRFRVEVKGGTKLNTLKAWQDWRKAERHKALFDTSLTPEEMEARLELIDEEFYRATKDLRGDIGIEED
jgi:hypothetical protein